MSEQTIKVTVDGVRITASPGQTVIQACDAAGVYIPRLCHHPDLNPSGHCRLCTCKINGRNGPACITLVADGMVVDNNTPELNDYRHTIVEFLFSEGNHFCPGCEASGDCELQAMAYRLGMDAPTKLPCQWTAKELDATHPETSTWTGIAAFCVAGASGPRGTWMASTSSVWMDAASGCASPSIQPTAWETRLSR